MEVSLNNSLSSVISTVDKELLAAEKANLMLEIKAIKTQLQSAYNNFDHIQDSLMIDYYTYQIKAYEIKYEYLIKKAKEIGLSGF